MKTRWRIAARFNEVVARRFFRWAISSQSRAEKFFNQIKGAR